MGTDKAAGVVEWKHECFDEVPTRYKYYFRFLSLFSEMCYDGYPKERYDKQNRAKALSF